MMMKLLLVREAADDGTLPDRDELPPAGNAGGND
jgi:hypothetical protein